jgi:creatinine amidohydrolase
MPVHTAMDLTAEELRGMLQASPVYVVQPVGNIEDHGPHLPLATDSLIAEEISYRLADILSKEYPDAEFVIAPTLSVGNVTEFGTRGGFSVGATLEAYLEQLCRNLVKTGYRKVILVNGCGGNDQCATNLADREENVVYLPRWWHMLAVRDIDESYMAYIDCGGDPRDWVGTHASELETSAIMAIEENIGRKLVRTQHLHRAHGPNTGFAVIPARKEGRLHEIAPAGVLGDARKATPEKGRRLFDIIVAECAGVLAGKL